MKKLFLTFALMCTLLFGAALSADAALYTPEECPEFKSKGVHRFDSDKCYYCDYPCTHSNKTMLNDDNSFDPWETIGDVHYQRWSCKDCGTDGYVDKGEPCKWKVSYYDVYAGRHDLVCTVCGNTKSGDCTYATDYKADGDVYHLKEEYCTYCKAVRPNDDDYSEKHTYKNNKCTLCGFQRIIPGKVKVKSIKSVKPGKKVIRTYAAHWDVSGSQVKWVPEKKATYYKYDIKVKLKKAKKAQYYIISPKKNPVSTNEDGNRWTSKKTNFTYKYETYKTRKKKVTLYITPVSKSGTLGKTVKKVVTLKN